MNVTHGSRAAGRRMPASRHDRTATALFLAVVLSVAGFLAQAPPAVHATHGSFDAEVVAELETVLDELVANRPLPGVSASVLMDDGQRWDGVAGSAELGAGIRPVATDTPFVIASITKTFVAALTLQLAEEGVLTVDDPLSRWMPEYPDATSITLRHLLSHTSGLYDYFGHPSYQSLVFGRPTHHWTFDEILALVGPPVDEPGSPYDYSNTNFVLLGEVAQRATGDSIGALIRERFLDPLGMADTWFQGEDTLPTDAAKGYLYSDPGWSGLADGTSYRPHTSAATVAWSAGAMLSTPHDLTVWGDALYSGSILSPASLAQMIDFDAYEDPDGGGGYGLGAREYHLGGRLAVGHGGSLRGFVASLWHLPEYDITLSVVSNRGSVKASNYVERLGNVLFRHFHPDTVPPVAAAPVTGFEPGGIVSGSSVPVELVWSAVEEESGIRAYELQESIEDGPWAPVALDPPHTELLSRAMAPTRVFRHQVRPTDRAGLVGEWATGQAVRINAFQEGVRWIGYSGMWTVASSTDALGGKLAWSSTAGATASFTFTGTGVAVVGKRSPSRGRARISIDGQVVAVVDLYASSSQARRIVFTGQWPDAVARVIEVRVLGTAGRPRVDLDAILVLKVVPPAAPSSAAY